MGLGSVLRTARTGLSAAELVFDVVGNNLANARTAGFKASRAAFAAQTPRTESLGAAPSGSSGGGNPVQIGLGVRPAYASTSFSQGSIAVGSNPLDLALQGDGLFILEGSSGERLFTRDGQFGLNAGRELVSAGGRRVLGFGVDEDFRLQTTGLSPLKIPLGKQVAASDGSTATLTAFGVQEDGRIRGRFTDGVSRDLGQVRVARFANPSGLQQQGGNLFAAGPNSGLPVEGNPSQGGAATIIAGATELSNTEVGRELLDLSEASTLFRANVRAMSTSEELLDALMSLGRVP